MMRRIVITVEVPEDLATQTAAEIARLLPWFAEVRMETKVKQVSA